MKFKRKIQPYRAAAGGWGSLEATTRFVLDSKAALKNMRNLMRMNKARGFDCPGCAWGDDNKSTFSFCENGAKAVTWEATRRVVEPEFFCPAQRQHPVSAERLFPRVSGPPDPPDALQQRDRSL